MLSRIRNNIITIHEAIGLDIHFLDQGKMEISGVHLRTVKRTISKVKVIERVYDLKDLTGKVPPNVPVAVTLNGKGILMRTSVGKSTENLVSSLFPGANPQEFVYATHEIDDARQLVYIARRTFVEEMAAEIGRLGICLLSLTLGAASLEIVLPFMNKWSIELNTPSLRIDIDEQKVLSVIPHVYSDAIYKDIEIGEDRYRTNHILGMGAALGLMAKSASYIHSDISIPAISYRQKDFVYYKLFRATGWTILAGTLSLLLFNFFVFNNYYSKNKTLLESNEGIQENTGNNAVADALADSSYHFFMKAGWNRPSRYGYYTDRIAALVPPSVSLTRIQASPVAEVAGMNDYLFTAGKIFITGTSSDPTDLETFSRAIKNIQDILSVGIKSYLYKAELNAATFVIEVTTGP